MLFPQMSESQIDAATAWIAAHCAGASLERSAMTVTQLTELAPLLLTCNDDTVTPQGPRTSPVGVAAKRGRT